MNNLISFLCVFSLCCSLISIGIAIYLFFKQCVEIETDTVLNRYAIKCVNKAVYSETLPTELFVLSYENGCLKNNNSEYEHEKRNRGVRYKNKDAELKRRRTHLMKQQLKAS